MRWLNSHPGVVDGIFVGAVWMILNQYYIVPFWHIFWFVIVLSLTASIGRRLLRLPPFERKETK